MFDITSRLNVTRTLGSTVMLGTMLFLSLPAATHALVPSPTLSLTANPVKVGKGGAATLSWASQNTKSCTASAGWSGSKGKSGSQTVKNITSSRTYKLTCTGTTKNISASVEVAVISTPPPPPPVQLVVGLNPQAHTGGMNDTGKAAILELKPHSLRLGFRSGNYMPNVDWAVQHGMGVMFGLGYGEGCDVLKPEGRQCYADRAARVVQDVGSKAQYYEVWNEWDGGFGLGKLGWNKPPANDAGMYTDLLCRTYKAIKAVRPNAIVAGGVLAGGNDSWVHRMLDAGAGNCMDVYSQHLYMYAPNRPYSIPPNSSASFAATKFVEFMTARENDLRGKTGRTIPIIVTEAGCAGVTDKEQLCADYITEVYKQTVQVPFMEGIWWYELRDQGGSTQGLLRKDNTRKPAFEAYKAAAE